MKIDAVAFDCDGVLVDARRSYDVTIRTVVEAMVKEIAGVRLGLSKVMPGLIGVLRRTGGFNSDWDSSYALTLLAIVALEKNRKGRSSTSDALRVYAEVVSEFGSVRRETGRVALDSYLNSKYPALRDALAKARDYLGYPARAAESRLARRFDEIYFGASLFEKIHGAPAENPRRKGLIELEKTLVKRKTLDLLVEIVGPARLVMITGRPFVGTEYSLGKKIMSYFHRGSSMFIGDSDIFPELRSEYDKYRKPSPEALLRASERLGSSTLLYVGDSGEDIMMAQHAREKGLDCLFAGVYGTSPEKREQLSFFKKEGADLIVESVNLIPSALKSVLGREVAA